MVHFPQLGTPDNLKLKPEQEAVKVGLGFKATTLFTGVYISSKRLL